MKVDRIAEHRNDRSAWLHHKDRNARIKFTKAQPHEVPVHGDSKTDSTSTAMSR